RAAPRARPCRIRRRERSGCRRGPSPGRCRRCRRTVRRESARLLTPVQGGEGGGEVPCRGVHVVIDDFLIRVCIGQGRVPQAHVCPRRIRHAPQPVALGAGILGFFVVVLDTSTG